MMRGSNTNALGAAGAAVLAPYARIKQGGLAAPVQAEGS